MRDLVRKSRLVSGLCTLSPVSYRELLITYFALQTLLEEVIPSQEVRSAVSRYFIQEELLLRKYVPCKKDLMAESTNFKFELN